MALAGILLALACAETGAPPGGPEDKTAPRLIGSTPANGTVDVPRGRKIELRFSERIQAQGKGSAVYISPRPAEDPKIKWKSNRLTIELPDSFADNQTYVVSVTASVTDLRNNKVDSNLSIAFSTGQTIASGRITGRVFKTGGSALPNATVALYDFGKIQGDGVVFDSTYADYLTQSNQEGEFTFEYLPSREYLMVAYSDVNKDQRLNPLAENHGLPDRPVVVDSVEPLSGISLTLMDRDTTRPEIISAGRASDGLIKMRFSRPLPTEKVTADPGVFSFVSLADSNVRFQANAAVFDERTSTSSVALMTEDMPLGEYSVRFSFDTTRSPVEFSPLEIAATEEGADQTPPGIIANSPRNAPHMIEAVELLLYFNEPIDTTRLTSETFILSEKPEGRVGLTTSWRDPLTLELVPDTLRSGLQYSLDVTEFEVADMSGNLLGDSLVSFPFSTMHADSLGWISGQVTVTISGKELDPVRLEFTNLSTYQDYFASADSLSYKLAVPGGKYVVKGFVDSDRDSTLSGGSLFPFRSAETFFRFDDTIAVRARFETDGVDFTIE